MGTSAQYPNGQTLLSSVRSEVDIETIFQVLIAGMLGIDTSSPYDTQAFNDPRNPAFAVRMGWQQQGQPAWTVDQDVCVIMASPENPPFSQWRDNLYENNDDISLNSKQAYTQTWKIHVSVYGPNCIKRANLIVSGMTQEYFHDILAAQNIYIIPKLNRPVFVPEQHDRQWWNRADVELRFNELVNEQILVTSAAGVDVTIDTDTGATETIQIRIPE